MDKASSLCSANRKRKCATSERFFLNNFRGNQIIRKQENIVVKLGGNCMAGMEFEYLAQQLKQPIRKLRILFVTNYYLMTNLNKFLSSPSNYFDEFFYEFNFSKDFFFTFNHCELQDRSTFDLVQVLFVIKKVVKKKVRIRSFEIGCLIRRARRNITSNILDFTQANEKHTSNKKQSFIKIMKVKQEPKPYAPLLL